MRQVIILTGVFSLVLLMLGCGGSGPANNAASNNAVANSNNILQTTTPTPEAVTNNAPTLTPVFKAFCEAWIQSNEAALRRVYSSDTIAQFESEMKADKVKSLIKYLEDTDRVSGTPCEVTNEKITGDSAVGRITTNRYPNGIEVVFVKENGEWKLTNRAPTLNRATNSNSR
jgi:hypothetical protein